MQLMKNTIRMTIVMIAAVIALYSYAADRSGIDIETLVETVYLGDTDSFIELKDRAKSDDSAAQLALARLYNVGRNYNTKTPESSNALADIGSSDKYEYWLKKSADGGNAEAAEELGCLYLREASKWEMNRPRYENRTEDAVKYLEMAAEKGRPNTELGDAYARLARKTRNPDFFKKAYDFYDGENAYWGQAALFISFDYKPFHDDRDEMTYECLEDLEKVMDKISKMDSGRQDSFYKETLQKLEAARERIKNKSK